MADDKQTEEAPFGYTKSGRPRKRRPPNPTGKKGKHKPNQASSRGSKKNPLVDQTGWRKELQSRQIKFDDEQKDIYVAQIAEHGRKGTSALAADTTMATVIRHRDNDPIFDERCEQAGIQFRDKVVDHHTKLLFEGEITKKFDKEGNCIEEKHTYPIPLILAELKRQEPEYREKQTIDLGVVGGVMVAPARISPQDWIKRQEEKNLLKKAPEGEDE